MNSNTGGSKNKDVLKGAKVRKVFKVGTNIVEVLKGVDVTVKKGEFLILFGSSGCGKSTLLNTLVGLEVPTSGKVTFMGKDLYSYDEDGRSQIRKEEIGFIYQQQNWIKSLSVLENVGIPLTLSGVLREEREAKAIEKLKQVHMEQSAYQAPTELSSGQQQRVSFARALISDPALVVADEPTGNLDSKSSIELMEMFAGYNNSGYTIIMVTHDLGFLSYATRVINMSDGEIIGEYFKGDKELDKFRLHNNKK